MYHLQCTILKIPRFADRFRRRRHHSGNLPCFPQQSRKLFCSHLTGINQQLQPINAFIGFLFTNFNLRQKIGTALAKTSRTIISPDRSTASQQLFTQHGSNPGTGQSLKKPHHTQRKSLGSLLHFKLRHHPKNTKHIFAKQHKKSNGTLYIVHRKLNRWAKGVQKWAKSFLSRSGIPIPPDYKPPLKTQNKAFFDKEKS